MRLRTRAAVLVAIANAAVFAVLGAFVSDDVRRRHDEENERSLELVKELGTLLVPLLDEAMGSLLISGSNDASLELDKVLSWPHWRITRDAVLMDQRFIQIAEEGPIVSEGGGWCLNPVGVAGRSSDFDLGRVKRLIRRSIETRTLQWGEGGLAIPVMSSGRVRGGAYLAMSDTAPARAPTFGILIGFIASTITLTGVASFVVATSVVRPVEMLAHVGRRIAGGDLGAEPASYPSSDEMGDLTESMRGMLRTLQRHRVDLETASALAADRATKAERELLVAQRLASMGTLAAGIAHEINNPLGGLMNAVRRLQKGDLPAGRVDEYHELVLEGLERIRGIVGRVLSMAPKSMMPMQLVLRDAAREAVAFAMHRAQHDGVELTLRCADGADDRIQGDRGEMVQAFLNLIINSMDALADRVAAKGAVPPPRVDVEIRSDEREVIAVVTDNGTGVSPALLDRILDPFFSTKEPGRGTGLGLTVVFAVVRNHGGTLKIANAPAGGFVAEMRFPRAAPPAPRE